MNRVSLFVLLFCILLLVSCKSAPTADSAPRASVYMRDGSVVTGAVLDSSPSEIKIALDDKTTRAIPMSQVKSVEYQDAAPAGGAPAAAEAEPASAHSDHYHAGEGAVTTKTSVAPVGTEISVRVEETIDSGKAIEGQTFAAEVTRTVRDAAGDIVIPRGSNATIIIRSAAKGGHFHGQSDLVLDLATVSVGGRQYHLSTVDLEQKGHQGVGANKRTAEFAGGGAAVGAIIGAIAGQGKGAAIGAGSGAGAGVATEILTKGGSIKIPVESVLTFRLDRPLRVAATQ